MPRKKSIPTWDPELTLWEVPDAAWERIEPILAQACPPNKTGPKRTVCFRRVLNAVIFRMRSGCQWNHLPTSFGDDSRIHDYFQRWARAGAFGQIWAALLEECAELDGVNWTWQSADGCMNKARFGGEKKRTQSHGPGKAGDQEKPVGRGRRRSVGGGD